MQLGCLNQFWHRRPAARAHRRHRAASLAAALALGALGTGPAGTASAANGAATLRLRGATPSPGGCRRPVAAGSASLELHVAGHERLVIVHVPAGDTNTTPLPLVLNLHGSESNAHQEELLTGMDATADRDRFVVAYPQGLIAESRGDAWNVPGEPLTTGAFAPKSAPDDVGFLTQLPTLLAARYCLDLRRVYATGISGGGRMASQLACDAPSTFAAVAPVAGLRYPGPCRGSRAVPVLAFHGTADPIDPYGGHGLAYWTYSVPVAAQRWATHERCGPATVTHHRGSTLRAYTHCAQGSAVELYTVAGAGHEWPGGPALPPAFTRVLGPQSNAVDANDAMWRFFRAYALPAAATRH